MNPFEAYKYMKETGNAVKAEKIPYWIDNPRWIDRQYKLKDGETVLTMDGCGVTIREDLSMEWLNWWMNFCYNTNSQRHNVELIPI